MTDATNESGEGSTTTAGSTTATRARRTPGPITPAAALGRHIEWLEFALAAARSEESWRVGRVEKATKKNRDKRTMRLDEVRDEILELAALVDAIRGLQTKAAPRSGGRSAKARPAASRKRASTTPRKRASSPAAATPTASATPAAAPKATTAKATTAKTTTAKAATSSRTRSAAAAKPAAGSVKRSAAARKRSTTAKATPKKASTTGATPQRRARRASTAPAAPTTAGQA